MLKKYCVPVQKMMSYLPIPDPNTEDRAKYQHAI